MPGLDEDAYLNRETFANYGLAMYHAQCVEKSLAILESSVFNISDQQIYTCIFRRNPHVEILKFFFNM